MKISFQASNRPKAQAVVDAMKAQYGDVPLEKAEIVVALGGDGFMLHTLRQVIGHDVPVYGMNAGSLGFLMNEFRENDLLKRLESAETITLHPLRMTTTTTDGATEDALAINEVSLLRQTYQAAKIRILIDGKVRMDELVCDGVLISTPAGSTAYNLSAHGPIIPVNSEIMCMTPISAFRPRRWRGALLPHDAKVRFEVIEAIDRPVSATADNVEVREIASVDVAEDRSVNLRLLYDEGHNLADRIVEEQFLV